MKIETTQYVLISLLIFLSGCGRSQRLQIPGITDQNATAIVLDHNMELRDFVQITPEMDVDRIEFHAPNSGKQIYVYAVGQNVHEKLKTNIAITSKKAKGYRGRVTVEVEDGSITGIEGNGFSQGHPVSIAVLNRIAEIKRTGDHQPLPSTVIVPEDQFISKLIEDQDGNLIPPNLSEKEKTFLDTVIPAIKNKDIKSLSKLIHKKPDDRNRFDTVRDYLEIILKQEMKSYRFTRIDSQHPDNKEILEEGNSLPVLWILRITYKKQNPFTNAELKVGEKEGKLLLPTTYAKSNS